ncbi:subtilisin-like protein [Russula brevipes]|nr:subtilisin-like protein [Russula brevipes]
MHWLPLLSILASAPLGLATYWGDLRVKHAWDYVPAKWECLDSPPVSTTIDLHLALKPGKENALIDALYEVSDPDHPRYGAHLSKEQVADLVAPHPDTLQLVGSWLAHHGIHPFSISTTHGGGWLKLSNVPLIQANSLLGAVYQLYRHVETNETTIRTVRYSLPAALHDHVQMVAPTTFFSTSRALRQTSHRRVPPPVRDQVSNLPDSDYLGLQGEPASEWVAALGSSAGLPATCSNISTPDCLRQLYNTGGYKPQATSKNKLAIAGYLEQYASHRDLEKFMTLYRPDAVDATFSVVTVNGGINNESQPGDEANLDIQYAGAISYPTPNIYYSTGGSPPYIPDHTTPNNTNEPYLEFLDFFVHQSTIPQVLTTSYGDDEQTVPEDYALSVCNIFARLGLMGVSVLFSSGDFGVGNDSCLTNDGTSRVQFIPAFPASCPFVTTVGGTTGVNPEVAVDFSGGGFSNYFPRPPYQQTAVFEYLRRIGNKYAGLFNRVGRAYPDISAQALNFPVVVNGTVEYIEGTSCSSPTAAGVVALLNDCPATPLRPPLGFLNPLIYSSASKGFNDITSGSNPGCGTQGFSAIDGWDPVTGLGTPDFLKLQGILCGRN